MTDLLTHVLAAFVLATVASWWIDFDRQYVPVAMVGAVVPDLVKIRMLLGAGTIEAVLGIPFSWSPIHRFGGALVLCGVAVTFFRPGTRTRAAGFLLAGAGSHFVLDAGITRANGVIPPYFYPFSWYQPPAGGFYLSSDPWPTVIALVLAGTVWLVDRYRSRPAR